VRFWDSSALAPLFVSEPQSFQAERWLRSDPVVIVWTLTRVELLAALARRRREEPRSSRALVAARRQILAAWPEWSEVTAVELVRRHAERLVESHALRAADALQLAAALVAAGEDPGSLEFVSLDERQAASAEREGFRVLFA
jgi:predicted nucleic acid-binding protein